MKVAQLTFLLAIPTFSACIFGTGDSDIWASPDSNGQREWGAFPSSPPSVNCIARYSAGVDDVTLAVGMRRCPKEGCQPEDIVVPLKVTNGVAFDGGDAGIVALSSETPSSVGSGQQVAVTYQAVGTDLKPKTLPSGKYECFLVRTGRNESDLAERAKQAGKYSARAPFVVK